MARGTLQGSECVKAEVGTVGDGEHLPHVRHANFLNTVPAERRGQICPETASCFLFLLKAFLLDLLK